MKLTAWHEVVVYTTKCEHCSAEIEVFKNQTHLIREKKGGLEITCPDCGKRTLYTWDDLMHERIEK